MRVQEFFIGKNFLFFIGLPEMVVINFFESLGFEHEQLTNDYVFRLAHPNLDGVIVCHVEMDPEKGVIIDQMNYGN